MSKKIILPLAGVIILFLVIMGVYLFRGKNQTKVTTPYSSPSLTTSEDQNKAQDLTSATEVVETSTISGIPSGEGIVEGKLCFPSESIPPGLIEAKRIDGKIFSQDYPGIAKSGSSNYSFKLPTGIYNLRFKTENNSGYHTTVCQTGMEVSCSDKEPRVMLSARVEKNSTVSGFDLCDFYFSEENTPRF